MELLTFALVICLAAIGVAYYLLHRKSPHRKRNNPMADTLVADLTALSVEAKAVADGLDAYVAIQVNIALAAAGDPSATELADAQAQVATLKAELDALNAKINAPASEPAAPDFTSEPSQLGSGSGQTGAAA
jgi:hypothetical protein